MHVQVASMGITKTIHLMQPGALRMPVSREHITAVCNLASLAVFLANACRYMLAASKRCLIKSPG